MMLQEWVRPKTRIAIDSRPRTRTTKSDQIRSPAEPAVARPGQERSPKAEARYPGIADPQAAFDRLKPFHHEIFRLVCQVEPMSTDELFLELLIDALDTAAYHFTGAPHFFLGRPSQSNFRPTDLRQRPSPGPRA